MIAENPCLENIISTEEKKTRKRRRTSYTKERIIKYLTKRKEKDLPLNIGAVRHIKPGIVKAMIRQFGDYYTALAVIGVNEDTIRKKSRKLNYEEIYRKIREMDADGVQLGYRHMSVTKNKEHRRVFDSARHRFDGGWRMAVEKSGVDYQKHMFKPVAWDPKLVVQKIHAMKQENSPLNAKYVSKDNTPVYKWGVKFFGSWDKALIAADIDPKDVRLLSARVTKQDYAQIIRELYARGCDLSMRGMTRSDLKSIYYNASYAFRSWKKALKNAGVPYNKVMRAKRFDLEELIEIVNKHHKAGEDLTPSSFRYGKHTPESNELFRVYIAAAKRYDSWYDFLKLAKIDPKPYTTVNWRNGDTVIDYLKERYPAGVVLSPSRDGSLAMSARSYFGTMQHAAERAGLVYAENGKIKKEILDSKKNLTIIHRHNRQFLKEIAEAAYFNAWFNIRHRIEKSDLESEAFEIFVETLPDKPNNLGIREYAAPIIKDRLKKYIRENFRESSFKDGQYFDTSPSPGEAGVEERYIETLDNGGSLDNFCL